jgi:phytoene dehydrogenase-like protein
VIVVGSGIGGLCCGALLSAHNVSVTLVESHSHLGGAAHAFPMNGYSCDSGPSLWAGCAVPSTNPLRQVLDAAGSELLWLTYDGWGCHDLLSGDSFRVTTGPSEGGFDDVVAEFGGPGELPVWRELLSSIEPVVDSAMSCPPLALSSDPLAFLRYAFLPHLLPSILASSLSLRAPAPSLLTGPASRLLSLRSPPPPPGSFVYRYLDYLSFALSGLPASGTVGAAVAYTLGDLHHGGAFLDYPKGGSGAVAEELADAIRRGGGRVLTGRHVEEILLEGGRAAGVRLRGGEVLRASEAVVSNADIWRTRELVPTLSSPWAERANATKPTPSFVHLWVGFDAAGIPPDLDCHHSVFNKGLLGPSAAPIDAPENFHIVSIPTLFDPSLAPEGRHLAHVYAAATADYADWEGMDRGSEE